MHISKWSLVSTSFLYFLGMGFLWAQLEGAPSPSKNLFPKQPEVNKKSLLLPDPKNEFLKSPNKSLLELERPMLDITQKERFIDPSSQYLARLNRSLRNETGEDQKLPENFRVDQYLGDFRSTEKIMQVVVRDHEYPDGDRIKILVNDKLVVSNLLLIEQFRGIELPLVEGFNKIDFVALNQGESGPNTAEVQIYNSQGQLEAANRWNLATGVKATYVIIKE